MKCWHKLPVKAQTQIHVQNILKYPYSCLKTMCIHLWVLLGTIFFKYIYVCIYWFTSFTYLHFVKCWCLWRGKEMVSAIRPDNNNTFLLSLDMSRGHCLLSLRGGSSGGTGADRDCTNGWWPWNYSWKDVKPEEIRKGYSGLCWGILSET